MNEDYKRVIVNEGQGKENNKGKAHGLTEIHYERPKQYLVEERTR